MLNLAMWFIVTQLLFDMDKDIYPMVVQAVVDEGDGEFDVTGYNIYVKIHMEIYIQMYWFVVCAEHLGHSHVLLATFEKV